MPYDPSQPANYSTLTSAVMRAQIQALNQGIQTLATTGDVNAAVVGMAAKTLAEQGVTFSDGNVSSWPQSDPSTAACVRRGET